MTARGESFLDRYRVQQLRGRTIPAYSIAAQDLDALNASLVGQPHHDLCEPTHVASNGSANLRRSAANDVRLLARA